MTNNNIEQLLQDISRKINISETAYSKYLEFSNIIKKEYPESEFSIYPQGSVRLGTVIKNYTDDETEAYDIDIILKYKSNEYLNPQQLKKITNPSENNLDDKFEDIKEKKPCWFLRKNGFSIDLTPAIKSDDDTNLAYEEYDLYITRTEDYKNYHFKNSNPIGYYRWFKKINQRQYDKEFKALISIGIEKDKIIKQLIRTNLQKSIQVLKYLRDIYFYNHYYYKDYKPASIVITTLVTSIYEQFEKNYYKDEFLTIYEIIIYFIYVCNNLENNKSINLSEEELGVLNPMRELLKEYNKWYLPNPTDKKENFMDRWNPPHDNYQLREEAFLKWIEYLNNIFKVEEKLKNAFFPEDAKVVNIKPYGY